MHAQLSKTDVWVRLERAEWLATWAKVGIAICMPKKHKRKEKEKKRFIFVQRGYGEISSVKWRSVLLHLLCFSWVYYVATNKGLE